MTCSSKNVHATNSDTLLLPFFWSHNNHRMCSAEIFNFLLVEGMMPKPRKSRDCGRWTLFRCHLQLQISLPRILVMFSFLSVGQVLIWNSKRRENFISVWKINWETQSGENKKTTLLWCLWKLTQHLCLDLLLQIVVKEEAERRRKMYTSNFKNMFVPDPKGWRHQKERDSSWSLPGDWWKQSILTQGKNWIWSVAT